MDIDPGRASSLVTGSAGIDAIFDTYNSNFKSTISGLFTTSMKNSNNNTFLGAGGDGADTRLVLVSEKDTLITSGEDLAIFPSSGWVGIMTDSPAIDKLGTVQGSGTSKVRGLEIAVDSSGRGNLIFNRKNNLFFYFKC